jgi:hypothetical protein
MPNSIAIANVEIQAQDGLQSGIPPTIFRTVPPVSYPSIYQLAYNGYTQVNPGGAFTIITNALDFPFVYLRNAGSRGIINASVVWVKSSTQTSIIPITTGGVFLFANNNLNVPAQNFINSLIIACGDTNPITCEWLIAQ